MLFLRVEHKLDFQMCLPTNISDGYHVWHSQEAIEIKLGNQSSQLQAIMSLNSSKVFQRLPFYFAYN